MTTILEKNLALLLDGRSTFTAFARATRREYERMAAHLARRWVPPSWCAEEDVVQELYVGTWACIGRWDPSRGPSLARYVVFNAMSHAKRSLHKARGAKLSGSADRNPSRIERTFDPAPRSDEELSSFDAMVGRILVEEAIAEAAIIAGEERAVAIEAIVRACETPRERQAVMAIAQAGDIDAGGQLLYDDFDTRIRLRLPSEEHAARYVARTAAAVVGRMGTSLAS